MNYIYISLIILCLFNGVAQAQSAPNSTGSMQFGRTKGEVNSVPASIGGIRLGNTLDDIKSLGYLVSPAINNVSIDHYDGKEPRIKEFKIGKKAFRIADQRKWDGRHTGKTTDKVHPLYGIKRYSLRDGHTSHDSSFEVCTRGPSERVFHIETVKRTDNRGTKLFDEVYERLRKCGQFKGLKLVYELVPHTDDYSGSVYMDDDVTWILERKNFDPYTTESPVKLMVILYDNKAPEQLKKEESAWIHWNLERIRRENSLRTPRIL